MVWGRRPHTTEFTVFILPEDRALKELDTGQKLRHEKEHVTHHHHWKKQVLLRIPASMWVPLVKPFLFFRWRDQR
jgi:hypothetical protein